MIVRVQDGGRSQDWLIPPLSDQAADYVFLDTVTRPSGPIELIEPDTCEVLATAYPPRSGPGVVVDYRGEFQGETAQLTWVLKARVDNLLFPPTTPLPGGTYCPEAPT